MRGQSMDAMTDFRRGFSTGQGRIEDVYDAAGSEIYYRPFVYGALPKLEVWGKKWRFSVEWLRGKWFKN